MTKLVATGVFAYLFPPGTIVNALLLAMAVLATTESAVGTRFTFDATTLKIVDRLPIRPTRFLYSRIRCVAIEWSDKRTFITVEAEDRSFTFGGWRSWLVPGLPRILGQLDEELRCRSIRIDRPL